MAQVALLMQALCLVYILRKHSAIKGTDNNAKLIEGEVYNLHACHSSKQQETVLETIH